MKPVLRTVNLVSLMIVFGLLFSSVQPAFAILQLENDGHERRDYSSETGKLTFLGAEPDKPITVRAAQERGISAEERSMAMVEAYGSEFGLKAPAQELMLKMESKEGGREITRYQQTYQGIPVMGGELVVNATERGELLSMNGEISPDLDISVTPLISREQAQETALAAVAKWNQLAVTELQLTAPELWIYDSRLLEADGTPPALVWRMDVFSADGLLPIRELVLVDAQRGHIALHFNQVDTTQAVHSQNKIEPRSGRSAVLSATNVVYVDLVVDVARNRLYGTDKIGNKVDVIDMMDMHLISSYLLVSGSSPTYLDIRPDGTELAVAQSGLGTIAFINLGDGTVTYSASLGTGVKGSDALYGRDGTLYILSTAGVHVFDTRTHLEDSAQKVLVGRYPKTGVLSPDKNTLYFVVNSSTSGYSIAYKFNISAGLAKPIQSGLATISNTSFLSLPEKYIKLTDVTHQAAKTG